MILISKSLSGVGVDLPISFTGMLCHKQKLKMYVHFDITRSWLGDSDYIALSLAKCLKKIEIFDGDMSRDMDARLMFIYRLSKTNFKFHFGFLVFLNGYLTLKDIPYDIFQGWNDLEGCSTVSLLLRMQAEHSGCFQDFPNGHLSGK